MGLWLNGRLIITDTVDLEGKVELEDWRLRDEAGCITRYTSLLLERRSSFTGPTLIASSSTQK